MPEFFIFSTASLGFAGTENPDLQAHGNAAGQSAYEQAPD
jgi:hypothetical protein